MSDTVGCPYCGYDNDMTDALIDLPSDAEKFDWECQSEACDKEFEVFVEFEPIYTADKIVYVTCERCGKETRDPYQRDKVFPFPESIKGNVLCRTCFFEGHKKDYEKEADNETTHCE